MTAPDRTQTWVRALCWATVTLEGFDIVALSAALPTILDGGHVGMDKASATFVTTISLVGIMVGAILVGPLSDRWGRRRCILASIALFSVFTLAVPLATNPETFGALRLVAGLGLGACMPAALTMMSEATPETQRARATTLTMTGYHVGAVLTALVALAVVPQWHLLFVIGGVAGLVILPLMWLKLPETNAVALARRGATAGQGESAVPAPRASEILRSPYRTASLATWAACFMGLLLVYGLNSWLPTIMREAGYEIAASLTLLLLLNLGGIAGLVLAGIVGDARGIRRSTLGWFAAAAVLLAVLSVHLPTLVLNGAVFLTGVFVFSAQVLVYAWITRYYPPHLRGTALGLASGVGRLGSIVGPAITGALVTADLAYPWGFYVFAFVAVLAAVAIVVIPQRFERTTTPVPTQEVSA
ncbi:aromatic acid/H+ symport family MFS transporter [Nocardioides sp. SLBN-35]|uniref:MFS transporter n=1 Tax=Nocardioides sp. SLBN-35 TaxID=2768445 RepID=UPI00114F437A|nr:aromatic acid/H+ symport family MFS transporter [Nocardioides sp. SLBN-35]TQK71043.1 putative MFS family arabinose efflux permease [Nocardioides sp. SLBN-35]